MDAYHPVEESFAHQTVLSPEGDVVRVSSFWASRPAVLVFLRQFRCLFCCEQVARFTEWHSEFERAGLNLVAIGNGTPEHAAGFVRKFRPTFPVYTDPSRRSYAAAGLNRRHWLSLPTLKHAWRASRAGHRLTGVAGDPNQQGGVLVVDVEGRVMLFHADEVSGDSLDPAQVWLRCRFVSSRTG